MWTYVNTDELYHHGIKGTKWGQRRYQNADGSLTAAGKQRYNKEEARKNYKDAKKELRDANRELRRNNSITNFGIKGLAKYRTAKKEAENARLNVIDAKAKYKAAKAKNAEKAEKAEFKSYVKEMYKTGLRDSYRDTSSGGKSTSLYNRLKVEKGKAYADRVEKKVQDRAYASIATSAAVTIGLAVTSAILEARS